MVYITLNSFTPAEITLQEAKDYVRVDNNEDDALISGLIAGAQSEGLGYSHVIFGAGTCTVKAWGYREYIQLPYTPLISITSFKLDGEDSTDYTIQGDTVFITVSGWDELEIVYDAGRDMPEDVKTALLQNVKFAYDYPDNMVYDKSRYFEHVFFRYREPNTYL